MVELSGKGHRFLAHTPLAAMLFDMAGIIIAANDRFHELLGYEPPELVGSSAFNLVHPDDIARVAAKHEQSVSRDDGSTVIKLAVRVRHRSGEWLHLRGNGVNLLNEPGFAGILATIQATGNDPTPMPRRRGWFEAVVSGTEDVVQIVDEDGRCLWASGPAERLLGITAEAMVGLRLLQVGEPERSQQIQDWFDLIRKSPGNQPLFASYRLQVDGNPVDLEVRANNLLDDPEVGAIVLMTRDISERVAAEEARQFAADLVILAPVAIVTTDPAGTITSYNPGAERMTGWTAEQAIGHRFRDLGGHTQESLAASLARRDKFMTGETVEFETELRSRDGRLVPVYLVVSGMLDATGKSLGSLIFGLDLREQTDVRQALDRTEARWLTLSKHAHELVALMDQHGIIEWAGDGFENRLGLDPKDLVGRSIRDVLHPDDRTGLDELDDLAAMPRSGMAQEYRLQHADGSWRIFDIRFTDLRHESAVSAFLATGRDITDRVAAEVANRRMAAAIESAGAAVILTDIDHRVLSWNKEAERLSGLRGEDVLGRPLHGSDPSGFVDIGSEVLARVATGATVTVETERVLTDGRRLPLSVTASPVTDAAGAHIGYSFIGFDISERRQAEREREARAAQSRALAELGQRALSGASLPDVLEDACGLASAAIGIPHVHVLLLRGDGRQHEVAAAVGVMEEHLGRRDPVEPASWTTTIDHGRRPVVVEDFEADDATDRPPALEAAKVRSGVLCAVDGGDGPIGYFAALDDVPRVFAEAEVAFLQSIANVLATAIDRSLVSDEMQRRALHDELTGLPNRALLLDRLTQAVARLQRRESTLGLLFIDIDRFKRVNDTLGHRVGDELLVVVAQRLLDAVRLGDTVARTGGDEFLVVTEEISDPGGVVVLAERVARAIAEPVVVDGHGIHVTASVGVALANAFSDPEELIRDADLAMYRAKQEGRDRIRVFDASMHHEAMSRLAMEESLRSAVSLGSVRVVFQPQVSLVDGRTVGVEALARWEHHELGHIPPSEFVKIAEEIGVLDDITRAVLHAACEAASDLRSSVPGLTAAVNLAPRQLSRRHVVDLVDEALAAFGLPADVLVVELTETAALDDPLSLKILGELRERGVRVSIDDFGTGYSSLARLTHLPADEVKIDRSFVDGVASDQGSAAVVSATVTLARVLGLRVIAEGVETELQRQRLLELGCTEGQGWLFSGPLARDELLAWVAKAP